MKKLNVKSILKSNAIWLVFIIEVIIFAVASGGTFTSPNNIVNILRQVSYYGIASVGMTFVILTGGIDLSIGSIITLVNMVCAFLMVDGYICYILSDLIPMLKWILVMAAVLLAFCIMWSLYWFAYISHIQDSNKAVLKNTLIMCVLHLLSSLSLLVAFALCICFFLFSGLTGSPACRIYVLCMQCFGSGLRQLLGCNRGIYGG